MPLSEQEQRLLDEMERHLLHNDADVGVGGLVAGVILGGVWGIVVGVIGFAAMLAGVMIAVMPVRRTTPAEPRERSAPKRQDSASFMDRMNDRWDRRQDGH
ncbi:MAG: hypothetical protein K0Q52_3062 [Microbacterium sp.]|nr:hypothetical protein [Microbacterium sp.]